MLGRHLPAEPQPLGFVIVVLFWGLVFFIFEEILAISSRKGSKTHDLPALASQCSDCRQVNTLSLLPCFHPCFPSTGIICAHTLLNTLIFFRLCM